MPGAPTALCQLFFVPHLAGSFEIDEHEIGIVTDFDSPLTDDVPDAGRGIAHPMDNLLQRTSPPMDLVEHQSQRVFDRRQARRRSRVGALFFLERVGCMIGRDYLQSPISQSLPKPLVIFARFY